MPLFQSKIGDFCRFFKVFIINGGHQASVERLNFGAVSGVMTFGLTKCQSRLTKSVLAQFLHKGRKTNITTKQILS